jgi:hypothetical protein
LSYVPLVRPVVQSQGRGRPGDLPLAERMRKARDEGEERKRAGGGVLFHSRSQVKDLTDALICTSVPARIAYVAGLRGNAYISVTVWFQPSRSNRGVDEEAMQQTSVKPWTAVQPGTRGRRRPALTTASVQDAAGRR